jgi:hypothetical protein
MNARRVMVGLLAMMIGAAVIAFSGPAPASAAPGDGASDSAMTLSGEPGGPFANLKVTVGQTKNLINQIITVSWSGGAPTLPISGQFGVNYLQIMQCWGDDPRGPDRTQCQYGGLRTQSSPTAGSWVRSRQVNYGNLVDPDESIKQSPGSIDNVFVPFWAVGKDKPGPPATSDSNDYFDSQVTNEAPVARTHGDGTGQEFFEVQTVRQAAGLGCGDPVPTAGITSGRKCWLVVVPRNNVEVDGSTHSGDGIDRLNSSPLSQSNWDHRIVFPLEFLPVDQTCPIGAAERRVIGHELATDAVGRWQPALCGGGGALYSYTQLSDDVVRTQVSTGTTPGLALLTNPIPPDQAPPEHPLIYAPVALSGLAIAFNIEHQPEPGAPVTDLQLDGQRFTSMKLTPRLVAKLLTQSYQSAVTGVQDYLKDNPNGLTVDPEFLDLNPEYKGFSFYIQPPDALVQLGNSDLTSLLWTWIKNDPGANEFVNGTADNGMVVNPNNRGIPLPTASYPRNDQSCIDTNLGQGITGRNCTLDAHPFTNDMHDSGRSASRGDSQARTTTLANDGKTPSSTKVDRQAPGHRALLAVVDAATANRYSLPTAALLNAAGKFVTPTTASLLAGEAAMKPSAVAGVLAADPGAADPAAYPLTALSYAVTSPSTLDARQGKDYATFLRYAAGAGQQPGIEPGQLPLGMAPLPDALKAQTKAAAATIEAQAGKPGPSPLTQQQASIGGVAGPGANSTGNPGAVAGSGVTTASLGNGSGAASSGARPPSVNSPSANAPNLIQQPVASTRRTPALPAPAVGALLLTLLIGGVLAATSSPVLQSPVIYRLCAAVRRLTRREVKPTEQ